MSGHEDTELEALLSAGPPETDGYVPPPFLAQPSPSRAEPRRRSLLIASALGIAAVLAIAAVSLRAPTDRASVAGSARPTGAASADSSGSPQQTAQAIAPVPSVSQAPFPLDPSIKPISLAHPTAAEKRALGLCLAFGFTAADVAGAGMIPHGRDAALYVPLTGKEPDLRTDDPAWIVAFGGVFPVPRRSNTLTRDPICVVVGKESGFYLPDGQPGPLQRYRLPPLADAPDPSPNPGSDAPTPRPLPSAPVDTSLEPVSKSQPRADAQQAMKLCGVARSPRSEMIAGMALLAHASDAVRYARLVGTEPEIATEEPAWLVQLRGRVQFGGSWANNPVCLIVDGHATVFSPEAYGDGAAWRDGSSLTKEPVLSLPPLAP